LSTSFNDRIETYVSRVDAALDAALPMTDTSPDRLHEAMRYAVFNGGKRVRPLLTYAAGECFGVPQELLDAPAAAIELIHAFSLVHDDLPAMDDDDLRRGQPTVHIRYDEATAILAADALQPLAFRVLAGTEAIDAEKRIRLIDLVTKACGSVGMTGGQSIDLAAEGQQLDAAEIEHMYALKTGALIHASIVSAGVLSDDTSDAQMQRLDEFGQAIGIAFQIKDDILDVEGETEVIGKPAGSDEELEKATYPGMLGVEASRTRCDELLAFGLAQLDSFGEPAEPLRWLANFIVSRGK
jgi:farnesyl diphosphate synthase